MLSNSSQINANILVYNILFKLRPDRSGFETYRDKRVSQREILPAAGLSKKVNIYFE